MSGFITDDGAHYLLDLFSGGQVALPSYYLALINGTTPGISVYGTELNEPNDPGYLRAKVENISGNWMVINGLLQNANEIAVTPPSVTWGFLRGWALCESASSGRVFAAGDLTSVQPAIGENIYFPPGSLSIAFSLTSWAALP